MPHCVKVAYDMTLGMYTYYSIALYLPIDSYHVDVILKVWQVEVEYSSGKNGIFSGKKWNILAEKSGIF